MSEEQKNELQKNEPNGSLSDISGSKPGRGHEEATDMEDIEIPRAKLIQSTSDEATTDNKDEKVDPGLIINSLTKEKLPASFIPIFKFTNYIRWNPRKKTDPNFDPAYDPGAMIFTTMDPNDPRVIKGKEFGPNNEPPAVTKYINFFTYFPGCNMPLILSFAKTSFAAGKRLNGLTQFMGGDMFSFKYKLKSVRRESDGTAFYVFDVAPDGKATQDEFTVAEKWYESFRGKNIKVHEQHQEEEQFED